MFSLLDLETHLKGADIAIYLVHSMLPSARLTQGGFRDFDMILADNFSRECRLNGVKKIIYLSGIIPPDAILSEHLQSRLEVENILKSSGIPTSSLRAGLILGPGGSSFEMMLRLVRRLPVMICPTWTGTLSYPISVWDVVAMIQNRIDAQIEENETLDLCGPEALSYVEMMRRLSKILNRKHYFLKIPFVTPSFSKLWVRLITGAPKDLVYPLVDSLKTHMIPLNPKSEKLASIQPMGFDESLRRAIIESQSSLTPNAFRYTGDNHPNDVRSVQRVTTLFRSDARTVARIYFDWLAQVFPALIRVQIEGDYQKIRISLFQIILLVLEYSNSRSTLDRQLYYITGGFLVRKSERPRIEFRDIYEGLYKIIAIHEYRPSLPWFVYKFSQAVLHLKVMEAFGRYLIQRKL